VNDAAAERGPVLDDEQFRRLAEYGEVQHAEPGRDLYTSGDDTYDFFLLRSATVDIVRDATAIEPERLIYRGGPGDFLGELNLLTGQHVYLTARVVIAGTVVRIRAAMLRRALAEQVDIADTLIEAFRERREVIRGAAGNALELVGRPYAAETLELRTYAAQMLLPNSWLDAASDPGRSLMRRVGLGEDNLPAAMVNSSLLRRATPRTLAEVLGLTYQVDGRPVDLVMVGGRPGGSGRRCVRGIRGPRHRTAGPRRARRPGRQERPHRELPGLPARSQRRKPDPYGDGPGAQVRRTDPLALRGRRPGPLRRATTGRPAGGRHTHPVSRV
jgi:thioredoxin reductase (NADPH)